MITTEPAPTTHRALPTAMLTVLTSVVVAAPFCMWTFLALVNLSPCFLSSCAGPHYGSAAIAATAALVLLALPLAVGVTRWRGNTRASLIMLGVAAGLAVTSIFLFGL